MASICCSPPDSVPANCRRRSFSRGNCENARSESSENEIPTCVYMRRFSATLRFGKMPRPSGTRHTPARASASLVTPLISRP